jgi:hypothetical protein
MNLRKVRAATKCPFANSPKMTVTLAGIHWAAAQDLSPPPVVIGCRSILRVSVGSFALLSPSPESAKETLP